MESDHALLSLFAAQSNGEPASTSPDCALTGAHIMRSIVFSAALVAASLFGMSSAFAAQAAPQGDAGKGKANFERVGCYQCHGFRGQGGREGKRIADPVPLAWPAFQAWVRTTSGDMPPYTQKVLSDQELI